MGHAIAPPSSSGSLRALVTSAVVVGWYLQCVCAKTIFQSHLSCRGFTHMKTSFWLLTAAVGRKMVCEGRYFRRWMLLRTSYT